MNLSNFTQKEFVSVIVPVFNDEKRIGICIESILNQSYPNDLFELLIVDNGSKDNTRDVIRKYPVQLLVEDRIQSSYAARNKGIQNSKGKLIAFTDSDCVASQNWIQEGVNSILESNAVLAAGSIKMFFISQFPNIWEYYDSAINFDQGKYINNYGYGATANIIVLNRVFRDYGFFREDLKSGGDYEFGRRLTNAGEKIIFSESIVVFHPARSTLKANLFKTKRVSQGHSQLLKLGLLDHSKITWRNFFPPKRIPKVTEINLNIGKKIMVYLTIWFIKYYYLFYRMNNSS